MSRIEILPFYFNSLKLQRIVVGEIGLRLSSFACIDCCLLAAALGIGGYVQLCELLMQYVIVDIVINVDVVVLFW